MKDLDFDELDKAVNKLMSTDSSEDKTQTTQDSTEPQPSQLSTSDPAPARSSFGGFFAASDSTDASSNASSPTTSAPARSVSPEATFTPSLAPAPATRRSRGRFMDVVHESSDMTGSANKPSLNSQPIKKPTVLDFSSEESASSDDLDLDDNSTPFLPDANPDKRPLGSPASFFESASDDPEDSSEPKPDLPVDSDNELTTPAPVNHELSRLMEQEIQNHDQTDETDSDTTTKEETDYGVSVAEPTAPSDEEKDSASLATEDETDEPLDSDEDAKIEATEVENEDKDDSAEGEASDDSEAENEVNSEKNDEVDLNTEEKLEEAEGDEPQSSDDDIAYRHQLSNIKPDKIESDIFNVDEYVDTIKNQQSQPKLGKIFKVILALAILCAIAAAAIFIYLVHPYILS